MVCSLSKYTVKRVLFSPYWHSFPSFQLGQARLIKLDWTDFGSVLDLGWTMLGSESGLSLIGF